MKTSLFADTHTYFGFNEKLITTKYTDIYIETFIKHVNDNKIKLKSDIEWQVKPGHIFELEKNIKEHGKLRKYFDFEERKLVLGKCDYMLQEKDQSILSNFYLIRFIKKSPKCRLFDHARKVRSYIFLDVSKLKSKDNASEVKESNILGPLSWDEKLDKLAVTSKEFHDIDLGLKALKVSRQVRIKILKIFSNYNNGIQDPILFPYFLDFTIFIRNLIKLINHEVGEAKKKSFKLKDLETKLNENIKVFQEGYNVRFLNGYQFENISDFDLDFNSSIQQLLTSYGSLVYEYGKLFYDDDTYAPIIQLNNIDTVSNNLTINYSIQHLTSPEFVFTTLLKEILNQLEIHDDDLKKLLKAFYDSLEMTRQQINESYLDDMIDSKQIDLNYFIIDSIRFIVTFNGDFDLFKHWFWSYNFQNSSLYDSGGMFNEQYLRMEMFRVLLIKKFYLPEDYNDMLCPSPELNTYWVRHYKKINFVSSALIESIKVQKIDAFIAHIIDKYLASYKNQNEHLNEKVVQYMTYVDKNDFFDIDNQRKKLSFLFNSDSKSKSPVHAMELLIFNSLNEQYNLNRKKITLLKRDWETGMSMENHISLYDKILYAIDQTGGVYFKDTEKMTDYFKYNANCLLSIIDFSYKQKKAFILKHSHE